jgi:hypothetical protein
MSELLARKLREGAEIHRWLAPTRPEESSVADLHLFLADLVLAQPLTSSHGFVKVTALPTSLRKVIEAANYAFSLDQSGALEIRLQALLEITIRPEYKKSELVQVLALVAKEWLNAIRSLQTPAHLSISLGPTLDLRVKERELYADGVGCFLSELPLLVTNEGLTPAHELLLKISAPGEASGLEIPPAVLTGPGLWELDLGEAKLLPGASATVELKVKHSSDVRLEVIVEFKHSIPIGKNDRSSALSVPLFVSANRHREDDVRNPFRPDLPLPLVNENGEWVPFLTADREILAREILFDPLVDEGRVYVIRGVRRSGKTSFLQGLNAQMRQEQSRFVPVYINMHSWDVTLKESGQDINAQGLLYELADSAHRAAAPFLSAAESSEIDETLAAADGLELRPADFGPLLEKLQLTTKKRVVFLLDELDWWIQSPRFPGDAQRLLGNLASFSYAGKCALLLSHDWTTRGWDNAETWSSESWAERFREDKDLLPIPKRLRFLAREALFHLIEVAPWPVTHLAKEYLWRLTGGWPGLAQIIGYELVECLKVSLAEAAAVSMVKEVVERVLASKDHEPFFVSLMASFSPAEIDLLHRLARSGLIELRSSLIRHLEYIPGRGFRLAWSGSVVGLEEEQLNGVLKILAEKQVIEHRENGQCVLRVGAFAYQSIYSLPVIARANE